MSIFLHICLRVRIDADLFRVFHLSRKTGKVMFRFLVGRKHGWVDCTAGIAGRLAGVRANALNGKMADVCHGMEKSLKENLSK